MNELADPELTAVYVESQNDKRERHDSLVTLTAPELVLATRHNEVVMLLECVALRQDGKVYLSCLLSRRPRCHVCLSTMVETGSVDPSVECVQTSQENEFSVLPGETVLGDAPGLLSETSPVDSRKCVVEVNDSVVALIEMLSNCQEQLRLAEQKLDERCEPLKE